MRFLIMHRTTPAWEAGARPGPELIARVGAMISAMQAADVLRAGEGLRSSAQGVRLRFTAGHRAVLAGPFRPENELPAGFVILRVASIEDAAEWGARLGQALGGDGVEVDVRPVTEAWDLGVAPAPEGLATRRYMALHKATAATEAEEPAPPARAGAVRRVLEEMRAAGVLLADEALRPSARGQRLRFGRGGVTVVDGPFAESKELMGGYVIVDVPSLAEARGWAERYGVAVGCPEVDLRAIAEPALSAATR
ncbi:YCII-related [Anaeromyxobacter dehalogenans 2CP-1]|uniref:YCII-related n=1 Tax=Anaeromyxobacter dehalogenans (strain ATCC BAA-258 / DSM 21875 / 2CP-1) TaxID=455488 RepID=B8JHE1_ANAD2|nr:YciI family protein [Anaeromyxobacter dehalogenans]ACL66653.1 YCII-related [Anaeromyxobacter dehalogenans 2CP-1]